MKLKIYQILIGLSIVLMIGMFLGRFEITISNGANQPNDLPNAATALPPIPPVSPVTTASADTANEPKPDSIAAPRESEEELLASIPANIKAAGILRVSNRSEHPVRVALLSKGQAEKSYGKPAHWDFAPGEGGDKGLMLSLPEGKLKVKRGDIVVVFAQDGSRRYWGPYVAGETASPAWNSTAEEWQLILQP
ncbi:hypothetical protein IQ269_09655 [Tychonema sp. LEGE 07199]|uniref:hypothetical protein n=1 Tax=unclassified Tychonema TaxID=2642144 RepID=UPI00187F444C|nr:MULTISPECIES: hypothetical protein [unclassified Tychonema]MBE9121076.1 hypothetical protein [Tychonema sp. LEGE 07199]MBE9133499.1 hypothetical protein [Tychonema sp. LEGE 07196]